MTDYLDAIQADIAFLKDLTEDGREPAVLGGATMVAAGTIFGAASAAQWAVLSGLIAVSPTVLTPLWLASMIIFFVTLAALRARLGGRKTLANSASAVAWQAVGWTIFTLAASAAVLAWRAGSALPAMLFPSIVLSLYGLGWWVGAAVSRIAWVKATAIASFLAAIAIAGVQGANIYLAFAAALVLVAIAPGVALIRQRGAVR